MDAKTRSTKNNSNSTINSYSQLNTKVYNPIHKYYQNFPLSRHYPPKSQIENETFQNQSNYRNPLFNDKNIHYYHNQNQTQFNAVNVKNPNYNFKLQNPPSNHFQGKIFYPMENQINKTIYQNNPGKTNYQIQFRNIFNSIRSMKEDNDNKIEKMNEDYENKINGLMKKMNEMKEDYEKKFNEMKEDYEKKIKKSNDNNENKMLCMIEETNKKLQIGLNEVKMNYADLQKKFDLNCLRENNYFKATQKIIDALNAMIENSDNIAGYLTGEIKNKSIEVNQLKKEISSLKEKIIILQGVLIGRKLMKILLKKICENCFNSIVLSSTKKQLKIINVTYKYIKYKYSKMMDIANRILKALYETNQIIHIDGEISQIIDIINSNTTYGEILEICKKSFIKKNDADKFRELLNDENLYNLNCKEEIIDKDQELKELLKNYIELSNI